MKRFFILIILLVIYSVSALDTASLRRDLRPLDLSCPPVCSPAQKEYFAFYGINFPDCRHWIGVIRSGQYSVAAQVFEPDSSKGTIVFIHGLYDHAGLLKTIIRESLDRSWTFAAIDLPGHGLSSGKRLAIDDFMEYRDALRDFLAAIKPYCQRPIILAGHSTGCSVVYEYCATIPDSAVRQMVFAAPLVRSAHWNLGKIGYVLLKPFSSEFRRWYRHSSHDTAFLSFLKHDPLGSSGFPVEWARAYYSWERRVREYPVISVPCEIIQGDHDETVSWRYNCGFLEKKCDRCAVHIIKNARHHLINEGEPWRSQFMELFFEAIENKQGKDGK
jgi:alpha-beta hydrolase superfamily lysophospholipase